MSVCATQMPARRPPAGPPPLASRTSPSGLTLFELRPGAAAALADCAGPDADFWLLRVAAGQGVLRLAESSLTLAPGDLVYGRLGRQPVVETQGLWLQGAVFGRGAARLAYLPGTPGRITARGGASFLNALLGAALGRLPGLSAADIQPLEIAILEFLTTILATQDASTRLLAGSASRNALLRRALQAVETRLSDPALSPAAVARGMRISLRYLQQLFADMGETPVTYIRAQRLARCHGELADPLYAGETITQICYRWGFSDAAYFSRVFRARYGLSPSAHRASRRA